MKDSVDPVHESAPAPVAPADSGFGPMGPEGQDAGRNAVFSSLVKNDGDITGLVAYSVFKQNELDWLSDFRKARGREPNEGESMAYIIGESTARRLATYRHLADATLSGNGPDVETGGSSTGRALTVRSDNAKSGTGFSAPVIAWLGVAVMVLVGVYLAARYGVTK